MKNIEFLNLKAEPEKDRVVTKTKFEFELEENGRTKIQGPLATFDLTRTNYRDLPFTMYLETDGDRISGSQNEAALVHEAMRLAGIGIVGTAAAAFSKAGSIGAVTACLALTGAGRALELLSEAAIKQSIRLMNPDLDLHAAKVAVESTSGRKVDKGAKTGKSDSIRMNQYESALLSYKGDVITIMGAGVVLIERQRDLKDREFYVIVSDDEITLRRTVKEAVDIGLRFAGLTVGGQIAGVANSIASNSLGIVGKGTEVLAKGLNAAAAVALKMGALLIK